MKVGLLCRPVTVLAKEWEMLADVASRMRFDDIGSAIVLQDERVWAVLTERDLARALADDADPSRTTVAQYMTPAPVVFDPETDIRDAARIMADLGIRHIPVVEAGTLVGVTSARDLMIRLAEVSA